MSSPLLPITGPATRALSQATGFVVSVPPLVVSAGAGGARLSIRLLLATDFVLPAGQLQLLHDPVGLTGERLLAHVYHTFNRSPDERHAAPAPAIRWLVVQSPLAQLWPVTDALSERAWRPRRTRPDVQLPIRRPGTRVAEPSPVASPAEPPPAEPPISRGILLLSESTRRDALAPHAAARLLSRAIQRNWSVFAVTREGPVAQAGGRVAHAAPPWRQHLVCRNGVLVPIAG